MKLQADIARLRAELDRLKSAAPHHLAGGAAALMEAAGLTPDAWQRELLSSDASRVLLLCTRQGGKSTSTAALALHTALYKPRSLTLLLSPALRQSQELFDKVLALYHATGELVPSELASALRIRFTNGSRIVALPGNEKTIRGYSGVDLLIIDEAARVDDDLYYSVRPMLAVSGGRLIALTTPFGKRGFFFREWSEGGAAWKRVQVTAQECPRISRDFLEEEYRSLGERWFRQEYGCEFLETIDSLFRYEDIEAAFTDQVQPLFITEPAPRTRGGIRPYEP